jgi:tetratricopeptide (TPR) repeat protein
MIELVGAAGIPGISRAYKPLRDVASLRTYGFLVTGKGNIERIDRLIDACEESSKLHPDAVFQSSRGRLLYARGRLAEAAEAFAISATQPCTVPVLRKNSATFAARCYFELYEQGQSEALEQAVNYVRKRLEFGPVGVKHAATLSKIALAAGDYEAARQSLQSLGKIEDSAWLAVRRAEIELADGNFLTALELIRTVSDESKLIAEARQIGASAREKSSQMARQVAEALD